MNKNQQEIVKWWYNGKNYQLGVMLLSRFSKNKNTTLAQTLMKPGKEKFLKNHFKLQYELTKAVGLNWKKMPAKPKESKETTTNQTTPQKINKNQTWEAYLKKDIQEEKQKYPKIIRKIKYEYSDLYVKRSILHRTMQAIGEENTEQNKSKRKVLLVDIKAISEKMDFLYPYIEVFEKTGKIPPESEVFPPKKEKQTELPENTEDLKKKKKYLQTANSKDRNILRYQNNRKLKEENPIPEGPKRQSIELRIKQREQDIEKITAKLFQLKQK